MSKSNNASRIVGLLVLLMAAVVLLSGPVAEVLDLPAPVAEAKKKKKKKKKKNRPPAFNVVQCPTEEDTFTCLGTPANDFLVGGPADRELGAFDEIEGGEGIDVYNGGDGTDFWVDRSTTSSDVYLFPATPFSDSPARLFTFVLDLGGASDIVGLNSYSIAEFSVRRLSTDALFLDGPGDRDIAISGFFDGKNFGKGKIETFLFKDGAFTADDVASRIEEASAEEQAALEKQLQERPALFAEAAKQVEEASS